MKKIIKIISAALAVIMVFGAFSLAGCKPFAAYEITYTYGYDNIKKSISVKVDAVVEKPADPERENYEFKGWFDENGAEFEFGKPLSKDTVVYACWAKTGNVTPNGALVIASDHFDGVFSPFFAASESDSNIMSQTQINMLSSDYKAQIKVGEDVPTVVKDYKTTTYVNGTVDTDGIIASQLPVIDKRNGNVYWTDYEFLIKNGIKFSDGSDLTIKDVLFNMYVNLDPIYDGNNTVNSVKIKGLDAYRTQDASDVWKAYDWNQIYQDYAVKKRDNINGYFNPDVTDIGIRDRNNFRKSVKGTPTEKTIIDDTQFIRQEFWKEIVADYKSAAATDFGVKTEGNTFIGDTNPYSEEMFTQAWEVFMYMHGFITVERGPNGMILEDPQGAAGMGRFDIRDNKWKKIYYNDCDKFSHDPLDMIMISYNSTLGIMGDNGDPTKLDGVNIDWAIDDVEYKQAREIYKNDIAKGDYSSLTAYINDLKITGSKYPVYKLTTDDKGKEVIDSDCLDDTNYIVGRLRDHEYGKKVLRSINNVLKYWPTGQSVMRIWVKEYISGSFEPDPITGKHTVEYVSGIKVDRVNSFNDKNLSAEHYVLKVSIVGVDPTAIWKLNFPVAPMQYYSDPTDKSGNFQAEIDGYANFNYPGVEGYDKDKPIRIGFKQFNLDYFNKVFKDEKTIRLPMGAGPYKFTGDWWNDNTSLGWIANKLIANENFYTTGEKVTNPSIKYLSYRVIDHSMRMGVLAGGDVSYAEVPAKEQNINTVKRNPHLKGALIDNLGYGYVGINAKYVQNINIRKIIMTAMDTRMILDYYTGNLAQIITRPMNTNSWAYPDGELDAYPFINEANVVAKIKKYTDAIGGNDKIRKDTNGKWEIFEEGQWKKLKYTFTIPGDETDHPAYAMFLNAARILNNNGFVINVLSDPLALSKLAGGILCVWAATRGESIDPDMYQTYHKDSTTSAVRAWGFQYMKDNKDNFTTELAIIDKLSKYIDEGRSTLDQAKRKAIYKNALNEIMNLAVEYPTYQTKRYVVYNKQYLDMHTVNSPFGYYSDPLSRIWEVELLQ